MIARRNFLKKLALLSAVVPVTRSLTFAKNAGQIMTVNGPVNAQHLGKSLIHEHLLVDFIGADKISKDRWNHGEVISKLLPLLKELRQSGCETFFDCTPNFLGRDVLLLKKLSDQCGLNIITNTGNYGGSDNKYLPRYVFTDTTEELSKRWVEEWITGIEGTGIKPGFIKISVNDNVLSEVSKKLIAAAAQTHLETGLTIASHTGPFLPAKEQADILHQLDVDASAFIWVHAQNEIDWNHYTAMVKQGAWVSLDGLNDNNVSDYVNRMIFMKRNGCLHRTLVSHDAGWFDPAKSGGGEIRGYATLFQKLLPALKEKGFSKKEIDQLIEINPARAFTITLRKYKR